MSVSWVSTVWYGSPSFLFLEWGIDRFRLETLRFQGS